MTTEMMKSLSVPDLIQERQARLDAAHAVLNDPVSRKFALHLTNSHSIHDADCLKYYTARTDRELWRRFLDGSGLWDLMSRQERERWRKVLDEYSREQVEPFDFDTARGVFHDVRERKDELRKEALENLFRRLSWDHKTNQPSMFGAKLIYKGFYDRYGRGHATQYGDDSMADLLRELYRLDGKPEPGWWPQFKAGYVEVQGFKNGNAHIHLLRPDLVDRLNAELASYWPGALPAPKRDKQSAGR